MIEEMVHMLQTIKEWPYKTRWFQYNLVISILLFLAVLTQDQHWDGIVLIFSVGVIIGEIAKRYKSIVYTLSSLVLFIYPYLYYQSDILLDNQFVVGIWVLIAMVAVLVLRSPYPIVTMTRDQWQEIIEKFIRLGLSTVFYNIVILVLGLALLGMIDYLFSGIELVDTYEYWYKIILTLTLPVSFFALCDYQKLETFPKFLTGLSQTVGLIFFLLFTGVIVVYVIYSFTIGNLAAQSLIRNVLTTYIGLAWVMYYLVPKIKTTYLFTGITVLSIIVIGIFSLNYPYTGVDMAWYYTLGFIGMSLLAVLLHKTRGLDSAILLFTAFLTISSLPIIGSIPLVYQHQLNRYNTLAQQEELQSEDEDKLVLAWHQILNINYDEHLSYTEFEREFGFPPMLKEYRERDNVVDESSYYFIDGIDLDDDPYVIDISDYTQAIYLTYNNYNKDTYTTIVEENNQLYYRDGDITVNLTQLVDDVFGKERDRPINSIDDLQIDIPDGLVTVHKMDVNEDTLEHLTATIYIK